MNLGALDLNLLVALDALLAEASVGRAAQRIGLSQSATSHALRRPREALGDSLLVRVGARMELTPRAESLRAPLREALERVRGLFVAEGFNTATSTRRFALMMPDHVVDLVMPALVDLVARRAPGVRLDVTPWRGPSDMGGEQARSLDLVIACTGDAFPGFHRQRLFSDTEALAVRRVISPSSRAVSARIRSTRGWQARESNGRSRSWYKATCRRCTSWRTPTWSPSCRAA